MSSTLGGRSLVGTVWQVRHRRLLSKAVGGMGGKRRAQPSGQAHGKQPSGRELFSPSEDMLQRLLPLLLLRVDPEGAAQFFFVCKSWRRELEAQGFCRRTVQLCSVLSKIARKQNGSRNVDLLRLNVGRRLKELDASAGEEERSLYSDAHAFLEHSEYGKGGLHEWLQAASQEPDASFLSGGAASTAQSLGLALVHWVSRPQAARAKYSGPLTGHSQRTESVAVSSRDGKRAVSGSGDKLVKIWDTKTGAEVIIRA